MGTRERWYKTRKLLVKILKEAKKNISLWCS
jgi:hypothetical protein